jgi:hypothetical protein
MTITDEEWDSWHEAWTGQKSPLPAIERLARRSRLANLSSNLAFAVMSGALIVSFGFSMLRPQPVVMKWTEVGMIVFLFVNAAFYYGLQRDYWRLTTATPSGVLDKLEARIVAGQRIAQLVRWGGLVVCVATTAATHAAHFVTVRGMMITVFTFLLTWTAPIWVRRRDSARRQKLAKLRAELDASETA